MTGDAPAVLDEVIAAFDAVDEWSAPRLKEALEAVSTARGAKLAKTQAFHGRPEAQRQKTNNHVERMNRRLRSDEKARYKWRRRKSIVRFVLLRISRHVPRPKTRGRHRPPPAGGGCASGSATAPTARDTRDRACPEAWRGSPTRRREQPR